MYTHSVPNPSNVARFRCALLLFLAVGLLAGCQKFLDIPSPPDKIDKVSAFESDATATAAVVGIYGEMINSGQLFTSGFATFYAGLSADELRNYTPGTSDEFTANEITQASHSNLSAYFWSPAYKFVYSANLAIEQLSASTKLTPPIKASLLGEAKFCRAFCYFYLANLFGDVPLVLSTEYRENSNLPRTPVSQVHRQIINDLEEARTQLPAAYPTLERGRPNKWAATALLSRVYLYAQNWTMAESLATEVIASGTYSLTAPTNTFLKTSQETIWQLIPGNTAVGTWEAFSVLPATSTSTPTYVLTSRLLNAFESGDGRRNAWVGTRTFAAQTISYPAKYKFYPSGGTPTEAYIVLRLAEQYLTRAEARANQMKLTEARADINIIRQRAGLTANSLTDQSGLLTAIQKERQVEFFAEWGHRWLDAKRTSTATVLFIYKPAWQVTDVLWPIPIDQLNLNPALNQNPGY